MQLLTQANDGKVLNGFFLYVVKSQIPDSARAHVLDPYLSEDSGQLRMVIRIRETNKYLKRDDLIRKIQHYIANDMGFRPDSFHVTGKVKSDEEYIDGKRSKTTGYYPTGEVERVSEYIDGKISKVTLYYKTGERKESGEFVNGKISKVTFYHKNGEVKNIEKY